MSKPFRYGSAISLAVMASTIAGCAAPQRHAGSASSFGGRANGEIGLATRALAALTASDFPAAIGFAERAVAKTPDDAGFRALLGNAYFGAGRFASAESAFKDALSIYSNQPNVVIKLALVEIAQGKNAEAISFLNAGRAVIDPADYGLALALAGRPGEAIAALEPVARAEGADARVRQNLALAYAISGDWDNARAIAAQDVPANQLEARIQQWMQLAKPTRPSDQVAALLGVTPAATDPGQPIRLALVKPDNRPAQAQAAPVAQPPVAQPQVAVLDPAPAVEYAPPPPPIADFTPPPPAVTAVAPPAVTPAFSEPPPARKPAQARRASAPVVKFPLRSAVLRREAGKSLAVVQLGAYGDPKRVAAAWNAAAKRFGEVRGYTPVSARFDGPRGTVYRLSIKGFASDREARLTCESLRRSGGSCFVRNVAGDRPVQLASR